MSSALPNSVYARDVEYILHPVTNARKHEEVGPIVIDRGEGIYVYDDRGNKYIEGMAGLWSVAVGFGEKRIADAAYRQLQKLPYYHTFSHKTNAPSVDLAERLVKMTPASVNRVFFTNSGSEANDTVVKLIWYYNNARGKPQKKRFLARTNAYHGITMVSGSLTGLPVNHRDFDLPIIPVTHLTCPHYWRNGLPQETEAQFTDRLIQELEDTIAKEGADTIAAFIGEPVMGAGGVMVPPEGYWPRVQEICRKNDILLIADEVITGFGRVGTTFACEHFGIEPDVLVTSKQIASSYAPLAAVIMSDAIYQVIADNTAKIGTLGHGFTTTGHPVSCAIANENLAIIEERGLIENARVSGAVLQEELAKFRDHPLVGEVRGIGLIAVVELVADKANKTRFDPVGKAGAILFAKGHEHGVIVRAMGDQIAFCPPLIITTDEVREMVRRFGAALEDTYAALKADGVI
ncbi:aspartate aminotransferase family protein [Aureimonas fodinaquatilis]|uniref:Aspartate aminotransferase family protein n=1 Tax=Aureimonas fodinaquatilis TaxID=2565783 RepID=A0A5B0E2U3_9HYPH|nr:aspartate aminotransferase family protein [Aureimonas fodinaquatilis]KAA0972070.1 aspartate aminotransferase family protein [Aureimonas fodinaquatilis]